MAIADYTIEVHPSVVFKLGEDLISDDYQALAELAKNSYDADATKIDIRIDTDIQLNISDMQVTKGGSSSQETLKGCIEVIDNGCGMCVDDIVRGWLTISASHKRKMKERGEKTERGRTPLGDKGLGRLGAQKLGRCVELLTRKKGHSAYRVLIDWNRFKGDDPLSSIPIAIEESDTPANHGTVLRVIGLSGNGNWKNEKELQTRFLGIVSPYSEEMGCRIRLSLNGGEIDLRELSKRALEKSIIAYDLEFDGEKLVSMAHIDARYLTNLREKDKRAKWNELIRYDDGKSFFGWLSKKNPKKMESYGLAYGGSKEFCEAMIEVALCDLDGLARNSEGIAANPGPFVARIDNIERWSIREELGRAADVLEHMSGVRVYRNGFGIPIQKSIIPFSRQWTSGRSWYTLRPDNVVGYFNITAADNENLKETTDREGFVENDAYRNLELLLGGWLDRSAELQDFLRRGYQAYCKEKMNDEAQLDGITAPKAIAQVIKERINDINEKSKDGNLFRESEVDSSIDSLISNLPAIDLLAQMADNEDQQIDNAWELVGLGLVAESVAHEMSNVSKRLISEARSLASYNDKTYRDERINRTAEFAESAANSLVKQVAHLDSSLRYVREKKTVFSVSSLVDKGRDFFVDRLTRKGVAMTIEIKNDFKVRMNEGKLLQVFDNLVINSEYWLAEAVKRGVLQKPQIAIVIDRPYMTFEDNGLGIDKSVDYTLFDPFVSRKSGAGRGLGLYICKRYMEDYGCSISLDPERNFLGRRYRFRIDLSGVLDDVL